MIKMGIFAYSLLLFSLINGITSNDFYVAAPSTFRLDADETIGIAFEGNNAENANVFIQDHPGKRKNITDTILPVEPGTPEVFTVRLSPANFPAGFMSEPGSPKLVSVNVKIANFRKEVLVPISIQSGYVFIQTDKPIYTPKQKVHMRIIPLTEETTPSSKEFKLQIKNPKGIIVEETAFNQKHRQSRSTFVTHVYGFPTYPVMGQWSATVLYGYEMKQNSTIHFDLKEYVLPTFTVQLKTQEIILPSTEEITANVEARYVYGKKVQGLVTFRLGVKDDTTQATRFFSVVGPKELINGAYQLNVRTSQLKDHKNIGWFPAIEKSRFVVEAIVVDKASGQKETVTDTNAIFARSPFSISFKRCLKDFKPGLMSIFEADINYIDGRPASGITTKISAKADGNAMNIQQDVKVSDENGKVSFEIHPEVQHKLLAITLETTDPRFRESQASGTFEQHKYVSNNNAYVAFQRTSVHRLMPGDNFVKLIHLKPQNLRNIYYMVVSKGKIIAFNKLPDGGFDHQKVSFQVTHKMVPTFRIIAFTHFNNELLADSLNIEVERVCHNKSKVTVTPEFRVKEPGQVGKIIVAGTTGNIVGLLGVDEAVYALSKKDLLTKDKVFKKLSGHDLGCGPGGGITTNTVLGNAGITLATNHFTPTYSHTCVEIKRRKREALLGKVQDFATEEERKCCELGYIPDEYGRSCDNRTTLIAESLETKDLLNEHVMCVAAFSDCCKHALETGQAIVKEMKSTNAFGRSGVVHVDELKLISEVEEQIIEKDLTVRNDFRETWIFEDVVIGSDNKKEIPASLPHSITTWVVQAVSLSQKYGICVAEPQRIESMKKIFLQLNLPYSVVRNEQIEVPVTVFNYDQKNLSALVYMYGAKDLCTGAQAGEKTERKRLLIEPNSAQSTSFPVIPLKAQDYPIKVVAITSETSDAIEKQLHVVPEGVTKVIDIPITLDPSNQQRRPKRHVSTSQYSDSIDPSQNLQVTAVKVGAPPGFIPGTASCTITAIGDQFGPTAQTAINNPDKLLEKPRGCGEQNMMFLAPTLYTMRYLKVTGKLTAANEEKGYEFIRHGYGNQLAFRKEDGSYAAYQNKPTSTWLTAFVMKVFCQAESLIHIDPKVLCSGVKWLIQNQQADGSYVEKHPMYHLDMMGGVQGKTAMTAFALIALEECKCDEEKLLIAKKRALSFLEDHLGEVNTPLQTAVVAYALSLGDSDLKTAANDRLLSLSKENKDMNMLYWETDKSAQDIETAGYALLNQLLFNDMGKSTSIVNWLNTKQLQSGSFKSTQDTVIALQALSEYAIKAQLPAINLVSNISSSNDRLFHKVLSFHEGNALVLQDVKVDKIGGTLFINTAGHGVGKLAVKLHYNIMEPDQTCKFDVSVNVGEPDVEDMDNLDIRPLIDPRGKDIFEVFPEDFIRVIKEVLDEEPPSWEVDPRNRAPKKALVGRLPEVKSSSVLHVIGPKRVKRADENNNSQVKMKISICARYLGDKDSEMSIIDVGIFSGFRPDTKDLKQLEEDPEHLIDRYESSSRGVVFYLEKIPADRSYCFKFHVIREYLVGKTQTSVVKVYDYYNPDASCTVFYSPSSNSPLLRTICEGRICECAEGGCPPKKPFEELYSGDLLRDERRDRLHLYFCERYDYVWKGKITQLEKTGGFQKITFLIEEVIKEGIEKRDNIQGEVRTLLSRDSCTNPLVPESTYLILGKDGQKYMSDNGETWYRYLLDKTSVIHMWVKGRGTQMEMQRDLRHVSKQLQDTGCSS